MGLLDKLFPSAQKTPALAKSTMFNGLTAYAPHFTSWDGAIYEALTVRSAIDARARHISKLKIELKGSARPKLQNKLKRRPNEWQTWSQFLYRTSTILDVQGTVCIAPVQDQYGDAVGFYAVLPSRCELREYAGKLWLRYEFQNGKRAAVEYDRCAVLTKYQYKDDFFGSDNTPLTQTMEILNLQSQGINEAVENGATYRFMAQMNNFASDEDLQAERKRFSASHLKSDVDAGGLLLFPNYYTNIKQFENQPYTVDSKQIEIINNNIYDYFGVNQDILQNKAYGDSWNAFYEGCVEVFALQFSEAMTQALFSDKEQASGASLVASSNRLQYVSNAEKLNISTAMLDRGIFSRGQVLEIWNLPATEEDYETYIIRGEYYNADEKITVVNDDKEADDGKQN